MLLKGPGINKFPTRIQTSDDAISAGASFIDQERIVPIFQISLVSGRNLEMLHQFLNVLPTNCFQRESEAKRQAQKNPEFHIDEVFTVPDVGGCDFF